MTIDTRFTAPSSIFCAIRQRVICRSTEQDRHRPRKGAFSGINRVRVTSSSAIYLRHPKGRCMPCGPSRSSLRRATSARWRQIQKAKAAYTSKRHGVNCQWKPSPLPSNPSAQPQRPPVRWSSFPSSRSRVLRITLAPRRQERKVTGQTPSSQTNVRDRRKISPLGRNDKLPLGGLRAFARVTLISLVLCFAPFAFLRRNLSEFFDALRIDSVEGIRTCLCGYCPLPKSFFDEECRLRRTRDQRNEIRKFRKNRSLEPVREDKSCARLISLPQQPPAPTTSSPRLCLGTFSTPPSARSSRSPVASRCAPYRWLFLH